MVTSMGFQACSLGGQLGGRLRLSEKRGLVLTKVNARFEQTCRKQISFYLNLKTKRPQSPQMGQHCIKFQAAELELD